MGLEVLHQCTAVNHGEACTGSAAATIDAVVCKRLSQTPGRLCLSFEALMDLLVVSQVSYTQLLQLKHPANSAPHC